MQKPLLKSPLFPFWHRRSVLVASVNLKSKISLMGSKSKFTRALLHHPLIWLLRLISRTVTGSSVMISLSWQTSFEDSRRLALCKLGKTSKFRPIGLTDHRLFLLGSSFKVSKDFLFCTQTVFQSGISQLKFSKCTQLSPYFYFSQIVFNFVRKENFIERGPSRSSQNDEDSLVHNYA